MRPFQAYLYVFIVGEILANIMFMPIRSSLTGTSPIKKVDVETFKGILERVVLFTGLIGGYSTVLVMFGALKLGTRLHHENNTKVSNNYFLVGNLLSAFIAIVDAIVYGVLLKV